MLYFSGKGCSKFPKKVLILIGILTLGSQQNKQIIDAEIIRAAVDNQGLY